MEFETRELSRARTNECSTEQWIAGRELRKTAEVPVCGQELVDSMPDADGGNPGVVHYGTLDLSDPQLLAQNLPVRVALAQQLGDRRFQPGFNLVDGRIHAGRRVVNPGMGHDPQELVHAGPRDAPRRTTFCEGLDAGSRGPMPLGIQAVRVNQYIGVGRDQLPRPL